MNIKKIGNLFKLAEKQILNEIDSGKRKMKWYSIDINKKMLIKPYRFSDLLDYAIILRKQLDRYGKTGEILKVRNIKSGEIVELETKEVIRHRRYLKERIKR